MLQSGSPQEGRTKPTAPSHVCQVPLMLTGHVLLGVLACRSSPTPPHQSTALANSLLKCYTVLDLRASRLAQ